MTDKKKLAEHFVIRDEMAKFLWPTVTPLSCAALDDRGFALGTGNYVLIDGDFAIITNEHVIVEAESRHIGHLPGPSDDYVGCGPKFITDPWPIDLAIAQVGGKGPSADRRAITEDEFCTRFAPADDELLFFLGFPGSTATRREPVTQSNIRYSWFGKLESVGVPILTTVALVDAATLQAFDADRHVAIHFPTRAQRSPDAPEVKLPNPKGMSGSFLWDTRFRACQRSGTDWTPQQARICGLVWAAHEKPEVVVATKVEHLLPGLPAMLQALRQDR